MKTKIILTLKQIPLSFSSFAIIGNVPPIEEESPTYTWRDNISLTSAVICAIIIIITIIIIILALLVILYKKENRKNYTQSRMLENLNEKSKTKSTIEIKDEKNKKDDDKQ